jgi:hypothetical protein
LLILNMLGRYANFKVYIWTEVSISELKSAFG